MKLPPTKSCSAPKKHFMYFHRGTAGGVLAQIDADYGRLAGASAGVVTYPRGALNSPTASYLEDI
jgi:hypothetical protein